jgi:DNA primase
MGRQYVDGISEIILDKVDILEVVSGYLPLKRTGKNYKALCPFHHEKTPSFVVTEDRQMYHCFGCGVSGNAISFVMNMENLDFLDAIEFISDRYNIDLDPYRVEQQNNEARQEQDTILEINKLVAKGFYNELKKNQGAYDYLIHRKISPETLRKFGVGFAPDMWDFVYKHLKNQFGEKRLSKSGLIIKRENSSGYYDRFRNRIMFPIFDIRGRVIGFGGRVLDDSQPKYLNSPDTPVFNKSYHLYGMNYAKNHLDDHKRLIIVEGYMDVISLFDKGIQNVAASLGTALTEGHGKLIDRYAKEVVLLYDSDQAGIKATRRAIDVLAPFNLKIKVLSLPDGYDPDDFVKKFGKEKLIEAVEDAKDGIDYMLDFYQRDLNFHIKSDVVEYINRIRETFIAISSPIEYQLYIDRVASETGIDANLLKKELKKRQDHSDAVIEPETYKITTTEYRLYRRLFEVFVKERRFFDQIKEAFGFNEIRHPIYRQLFTYLDSHDTIDISDAIDELPFEAVQLLEDLNNSDEYIPVKSGMREVTKLYYDVVINDHKRILQKIKEEKDRFLSNIERGGSDYRTAEKQYLDRYSDITSQLAEINKRRGQKGGE